LTPSPLRQLAGAILLLLRLGHAGEGYDALLDVHGETPAFGDRIAGELDAP